VDLCCSVTPAFPLGCIIASVGDLWRGEPVTTPNYASLDYELVNYGIFDLNKYWLNTYSRSGTMLGYISGQNMVFSHWEISSLRGEDRKENRWLQFYVIQVLIREGFRCFDNLSSWGRTCDLPWEGEEMEGFLGKG
jgi:hypothetical protein